MEQPATIAALQRGLTITALDPDEDYLGMEVVASNERFGGSAWIYARVEELSELAAQMDGFPRSYEDRRTHEFGNRDPDWLLINNGGRPPIPR